MARVGRAELRRLEREVNSLLRNVKIQVGRRYGYYALDFCLAEDYDPVLGRCEVVRGTLVTGVTGSQMADILRALREILTREIE
mgnify:CR=1 FL=1